MATNQKNLPLLLPTIRERSNSLAQQTSKTSVAKVSVEQFAQELVQDLPKLIAEHPAGVYVHHLHEYYGESPARILRAASLLETSKHIRVEQAANNSHYIVPYDYHPKVQFVELTDLQRRTIEFIIATITEQRAKTLQTNYSQLARLMVCSSGGIRTCLYRLVQLEYLQILSPSKQGKQSELLLALGKKISHPDLDT